MERIGVVLLAAGGSSRMGRPKQLLPFGGNSLLRHAAEAVAASGLRPAVVVLGAGADRTAAELVGLSLTAVVNAEWERGIGTSVRVGVAAALAADSELAAVVVTLADLPAVTAELLVELARVPREGGGTIVACRYGGTVGVPALFAAALFPELLALPDEQGAKRLIAAAGPALAVVEFPGGAADVDTPADYAALRTSRSGEKHMTDRRDLLLALGLLAGPGRASAAGPPSDGNPGALASADADAVTIAGLTFVFLTDPKRTGDKLSAVEVLVAPKAGAPPHTHAKFDESFFVLEGAFEVLLGDKKATAGPGDFVHIPGGTLHAFTNTTDKLARILSLSAPAGLEEFFRAVGHPVAKVEDRAKPKPVTAADAARLVEVGKKYGVEIKKP